MNNAHKSVFSLNFAKSHLLQKILSKHGGTRTGLVGIPDRKITRKFLKIKEKNNKKDMSNDHHNVVVHRAPELALTTKRKKIVQCAHPAGYVTRLRATQHRNNSASFTITRIADFP